MSVWSPTYQQSIFKRYHNDKHFSEFLPTRWRQKSTGIDMEQNYVTVTLYSDRQHSDKHRRRLVVISIAASPYSHSRSLSLIAPSFHPPLSSFPCPFSSFRMSMEALLPLPAVSAEGICSWDVFWRVFRLQLKCLLSDDSNFEYAHCWTSCRRHDEIGWRRRAHRYRPTTPW